MLSPLKETPFFDDLNTTFSKIEEKLTGKGQSFLDEVSNDFHFEPGPKWGLGLNPDIIETIRAACTERHKLKVNYSSTNSQTTRDRILGPHFLYFAKGSLYLVAEDLRDGKNKIFSMPRVNNAEMLDETYEGESVDPANYFETAFGIYHADEPVSIALEFSPPISTYVRERKWHHSQRLISKPNEKIELHMEVGMTPELIQWVLGFGPNVKVVSPSQLTDKIREQALKTIELYEKPRSVG